MDTSDVPPTRTSISASGQVKPFGPHQRCRRRDSVQAANTAEAGASKTRVIVRSVGSVSGTAILLFLVTSWLRNQLVTYERQDVKPSPTRRHAFGERPLTPRRGCGKGLGWS